MRYVIPKSFLESDITDEQGQPVFHVDSPLLSLLDMLLGRTAPLIVLDMVGTEVVRVKRANWKLALHATYRITRQGEEVAEIRQKEIGPAGPFTIDIPGLHDLQMTGSLFEHEYTIARDDQVVATVSKRWGGLTDGGRSDHAHQHWVATVSKIWRSLWGEPYGVEIVPGEDDVLILASVLAFHLHEMIYRDRD
jgi:uncharacterized protein YxjI